jgi:hypothetical protein
MADRPPSGVSPEDERARPGGGAVASAPRWVKVFAIVTLVLFVVFVVLHLTGHQLGGHMPSGPHQRHAPGVGSR